MKNSNKGLAVPLLIAIIAVLVIGGVYVYSQNKTPVNQNIPVTPVSVSINQATLKVLPKTTFTLSGEASAKSGTLIVVVVGPGYAVNTKWETINSIVKSNDGMYTGFSKTATLSGKGWSATFQGLVAAGNYSVLIYDNSHNLLSTGTLRVISN